MKLNVRAFAVAFALWWGVGVFLLTWWIIALGDPTTGPTFLGRIYIGYEITPVGSVIGLAWGLADGLVAGAIFAWLYNFLVARLFPSSEEQAQT